MQSNRLNLTKSTHLSSSDLREKYQILYLIDYIFVYIIRLKLTLGSTKSTAGNGVKLAQHTSIAVCIDLTKATESNTTSNTPQISNTPRSLKSPHDAASAMNDKKPAKLSVSAGWIVNYWR